MERSRALQTRINNGEKNLRFDLWHVERRARQLQRQAAVSFAKLNGWKHSEKQFSALMLARASTQYKRDEMVWEAATPHELFDHPLYFRERNGPTGPWRWSASPTTPAKTTREP